MGVVYKARDVARGQMVALKMIRTGGHSPGVADSRAFEKAVWRFRFMIEAETGSRLRHQNIVPVYAVGEHQGQPYFTMKLLTGGSLATILPSLQQEPSRVARLVAQMADAVDFAHDYRIVHRDLKPANILLDSDGQPHVADFGLSKAISPGGLAQPGALVGTPSYMAPEQAEGKEVGPPTDVWALGAILYQCLTGRPPFKAATSLDTLIQVIHADLVPPVQLQPQTPPDLNTICLICLRKDPNQRYAKAKALADDLLRFERGEPIQGVQPAKQNPEVVSAAVAPSPLLDRPVQSPERNAIRGMPTIWAVVCKALDGTPDEVHAARQVILQRYDSAVYRYLLACLGSAAAADEMYQEFCLRFVRGDFHNAKAEKGRFRDLLEAALYHLVSDYQQRMKRDLPEPGSDRQFLNAWRADLLNKAWEALELEEQRSGRPLHTVMHFRSAHPDMRSVQIAEDLSNQWGKAVTADQVRKWLHAAREKFSELLLSEVAASLREPKPDSVVQELLYLELFEYCAGAVAGWRQRLASGESV
jgi:serine/threonine-protein kinase